MNMMRKSIFLLSALLLLACGGKEKQAKSEDVAVSTEEDAKEEIVGLIHDLYATIAHGDGDIDARFACREWRDMVTAVEAKDAELEEIGFFNEDYWTEMQDTNPDDLEARDIKFEELDAEEGTAVVDFILDSSVQTIHLKFALCQDDGEWRVHDIVRFFVDENAHEDSYSLMEAMRDYLKEPAEDMPELTFATMEGIYDSFDEEGNSESRICLNADGTASWGMIGSLNYTEYTYRIEGNTICMKTKDVESEEDCYDYDPDTRALKNEQGDIYYRQIEE